MRSRAVGVLRTRLLRAYTRLPRTPLAGRIRGPVTVGYGLAAGLRLEVPPGHVHAYELVRGLVEPPVQEALRRHVSPGRVFYDVGANIGFFSLIAARLGAEVHAFEPHPESAATIRRNAAHNGLEVQVHEVAVAAAPGRADFLAVADASWSHLADRGAHPLTRATRSVDVVSLDSAGLPAPDVLKIDVEGSEAAVLAGASRLLRESRPVVICEVHETAAEVLAALGGYAVQNLSGPEPPEALRAGHLLATQH